MALKSLLCVAVLLAPPSVAFAQKQITLLATVASPTGDPIATIEPASVQVLENGVSAKVVKVEPVDRADWRRCCQRWAPRSARPWEWRRVSTESSPTAPLERLVTSAS